MGELLEGGKVTSVLGVQWGDEGKGKFVDLLAAEADIVCRCQGGCNAGHNIIVDGKKFYFRQIPSGLVRTNIINLIGDGVVVNLPVLFDDIKANSEVCPELMKGWKSRLLISSRCHIICEFHRVVDGIQDDMRGAHKLQTIKFGVGPTYSSKATRNGVRMGDLVHPDFSIFQRKFTMLANDTMRKYQGLVINIEEQLQIFKNYREELKDIVIDSSRYLNEALSQNKKILVEGAQGHLLDIDHGMYPMVTSSNCSIGGVVTGLGIPPSKLGPTYGIVKIYPTRVSRGALPTEIDPESELCRGLQDRGHEIATASRRRLRCGWMDIVQLRYAQMINEFQGIAIVKLDILDPLEEVKIGVAYKLNGQKIDYMPAVHEDLENLEVEYITLPGWQCPTAHVRQFADLPVNAQNYIRKIEELSGMKVKWVGVGPGREATLRLF